MKKEYIFIILIIIILYLIYLIVNYKYNEYIINSRIESLYISNENISVQIKQQISDIEYKTTNAYKNMILKKEQGLKNKGEEVIFLIEEKKYDKYTKQIDDSNINEIEIIKTTSPIESMTIFEKWLYLIFKQKIKN